MARWLGWAVWSGGPRRWRCCSGACRGSTLQLGFDLLKEHCILRCSRYRGNPGHQLLDCLLSQIDLFRHHPGPFESHQACDATEWYCVILRMLGVAVVQVPPDALACYDEAVAASPAVAERHHP